jgi:hypothetical protein
MIPEFPAPALQPGTPRIDMAKRRTAAKRELINTGSDKRYVRRSAQGQFKESDDVGRSLAQDPKRPAKTRARKGQGDRGDR